MSDMHAFQLNPGIVKSLDLSGTKLPHSGTFGVGGFL